MVKCVSVASTRGNILLSDSFKVHFHHFLEIYLNSNQWKIAERLHLNFNILTNESTQLNLTQKTFYLQFII
jgi:hypothetical protein